MSKWMLLLAGWIALAFGLLGIVLPVLPTTPFLLLAAYCFSRSSSRIHQWIVSHRWFGPPILQWQEKRTISRVNKRRALLLICLSFSLTLWLTPLPELARTALVILFVGLIWLVARLPVPPNTPVATDHVAPKLADSYEQ
ncbi:MAG: YbaN family protein [Gammaproteobacteria bacterium]|nr:YbaN family protein [Gammaproteobacteria bacterium]